jgi:hypothetical protein
LPREIEGNKRSLGLCIKQYEIRELGWNALVSPLVSTNAIKRTVVVP